MENDNTLELRYWLKDCPQSWINFRKSMTKLPGSRDICLQALNDNGYNVKFIEQYDGRVNIVFADKEEKTRFILTWS